MRAIGQPDVPRVEEVRFNCDRFSLRQVQTIPVCCAVPHVSGLAGKLGRRIEIKEVDPGCRECDVLRFIQAGCIDPLLGEHADFTL
jgi:hypothetical protein